MEFVVRLRPEPQNVDPTLSLRRMLKVALRGFGLRCVDIAKSEAQHLPGVTISTEAATCLACGVGVVGLLGDVCEPCKAAAGLLAGQDGRLEGGT